MLPRRVLIALSYAIALSAIAGLTAAAGGCPPERAAFPRTFKVKILNERKDTYVWVYDKALVSIWEPGADAGYDPITNTAAKLVLPRNRLGNGFQVPENSFASGYISLPKEFDMEEYIREGYELRLAVRVVPRGYYSEEFPFSIDPDIEFGNAYGRISLNTHFPPEVVYLTYRP